MVFSLRVNCYLLLGFQEPGVCREQYDKELRRYSGSYSNLFLCYALYSLSVSHYPTIYTSSRFGFWDILSKGLGSVTMSQSRLITLSWPWLFQISQKPHPIIINIVKVLQCHQISTFWCVINSSACTIDEWKYKSIAEKIFHNSAKHGCHFYEKCDSLSYTVKIEPDLEYFMESAGIRYLRTSC